MRILVVGSDEDTINEKYQAEFGLLRSSLLSHEVIYRKALPVEPMEAMDRVHFHHDLIFSNIIVLTPDLSLKEAKRIKELAMGIGVPTVALFA